MRTTKTTTVHRRRKEKHRRNYAGTGGRRVGRRGSGGRRSGSRQSRPRPTPSRSGPSSSRPTQGSMSPAKLTHALKEAGGSKRNPAPAARKEGVIRSLAIHGNHCHHSEKTRESGRNRKRAPERAKKQGKKGRGRGRRGKAKSTPSPDPTEPPKKEARLVTAGNPAKERVDKGLTPTKQRRRPESGSGSREEAVAGNPKGNTVPAASPDALVLPSLLLLPNCL